MSEKQFGKKLFHLAVCEVFHSSPMYWCIHDSQCGFGGSLAILGRCQFQTIDSAAISSSLCSVTVSPSCTPATWQLPAALSIGAGLTWSYGVSQVSFPFIVWWLIKLVSLQSLVSMMCGAPEPPVHPVPLSIIISVSCF